MKRVKVFSSIAEFEEFINSETIETIQIDVKAVEQSFHFQDSFMAIVFYKATITQQT